MNSDSDTVDYASLVLSRLPVYLQGKPKREVVYRALARQLQEVEGAFWDIAEEQASLEFAAGGHLDVLGNLVGEPRDGKTDIEYRPFVAATIAANRARGNITDLLDVLDLLELAGSIELTQYFPAALVLRYSGTTSVSIELVHALRRFLKRLIAAGVRGIFEWTHSTDAAAFSFATGLGLGLGFGSGEFSGALGATEG